MELITSPQVYNICFDLASLMLLLVTFIINASEKTVDNAQKRIFTLILIDTAAMNISGLLHAVWIGSDAFRADISYSTICVVSILERMFIYIVAYLSTRYVLAIFRVQLKGILGHLILLVPLLYSLFFLSTGFDGESCFYYIDELGNLKYIYPQGSSTYFSVILYFIFAAYLCIKYVRSLSSEKKMALLMYYLLTLLGIPIRVISGSGAVFEFSFSIAILFCVYTFQNPSEFIDALANAGTRNALNLEMSSRLIQKKVFSVFGVIIDRLDIFTGCESLESTSRFLGQLTEFFEGISPDHRVYFTDENTFMILVPDADSDDPVIDTLADQVRSRFRENWNLNGKEVRLFFSVFAIGFPDDMESLDKFSEVKGIIQKTCLHYRGIIRIGDLNLKYVEHDKRIDSLVRRALDDGFLEVYYQPIYNCKTGKYSSCEALLRMKDPNLGFISPAVFMPVAERNGCVIDIDNFVLKSVCEMLTQTDAIDMGLEYVEVNLSVVDCIQTDLADNIIAVLKKYDVPPEQINLEITETFEEGVSSVMYENMRKLRDYGVSFSMDDLGTGYSNLSRIATLPMDIFKIDKSIVQQAFEDNRAYMVMKGMMNIIKSLGKESVAEGVETEVQAKQIIRIGCDHIQGFFYARPMPKERFLEFLRDSMI